MDKVKGKRGRKEEDRFWHTGVRRAERVVASVEGILDAVLCLKLEPDEAPC